MQFAGPVISVTKKCKVVPRILLFKPYIQVSHDPIVLSTYAPIAYHDFVYPLYTFDWSMYV